MRRKTQSGRALSMPAGLSMGLLYAVIVILAGVVLSAKLIEREVIGQENMGYAVMIILIVASWIGAMISARKIKRQKVMVCVMSAGILWGFLMIITMLMFGGEYRGVGESALLILCGGGLGIRSKTKKKRGKSKSYNC